MVEKYFFKEFIYFLAEKNTTPVASVKACEFFFLSLQDQSPMCVCADVCLCVNEGCVRL